MVLFGLSQITLKQCSLYEIGMGKEDFHREGLPAHRKELGVASLNDSFSQQRDKWRGQHFRPDSSASSPGMQGEPISNLGTANSSLL